MNKTRDLPIHSFFRQLQIEYICAKLREFIYQEKENKKYYSELAFYKKEKIISIGEDNGFDNIFTDEETAVILTEELIPERGIPKFFYKDEKQRQKFEGTDLTNFFNGKEALMHRINADPLEGIIKSLNLITKSVTIEIDDGDEKESFKVSMDRITVKHNFHI